MDLSIVIPCLNEAETLSRVINNAQVAINKSGLKGEIIVADNGSSDGSQEIALKSGARVVNVELRGYGAALLGGINAAKGKFVIMGDADDSYALENLDSFIQKLTEGNELVMGNRFKGGIAKGAMPWLHKYIGNPLLSWIGRKFFKIPIYDFHCGLRGFQRSSVLKLNLNSTGMEFASEMVVKAALNGLRIVEVPTILRKDGRNRPPHLRTWRDGWRHLIFLLAASPRWLFLYPGTFLSFIGLLGMVLTFNGPQKIGNYLFDTNTFVVASGILLVGTQTIQMAILARIFSARHGFLPDSKTTRKIDKFFTLERGIFLSMILVLIAMLGLIFLLNKWTGSNLNGVDLETSIRISGMFVIAFASGVQFLFTSFFISMLRV